MSDTGKIVVCILSSLSLCSGAKAIVADTSANPYQGIVDRNVFGLKPPTPITKDTTKDTPPPPKITLTGITTIFHDKRALMNVAMPAKPSEPAKNQSFILAEHQREGEIEVLEIDVKTGDVKVSNFGTVVTLNLEKDGAKLPNTPALPIAGAQPNPAGYVPPGNPSGQPPGMKTIPTRQFRTPESGAAAATAAPNYASNESGGIGAVPSQQQVANQSQRELTTEEGMIMMEAQYHHAVMTGDSTAAIFPPTDLDPTRNTGHTPEPEGLQASPGTQNSRILPPIGRPISGFPQ